MLRTDPQETKIERRKTICVKTFHEEFVLAIRASFRAGIFHHEVKTVAMDTKGHTFTNTKYVPTIP